MQAALDLSTIEDAATLIIERLNACVVRSGARLESNICYSHHHSELASALPFAQEKAPLRENFVKLARKAASIIEIGFNAGHSAALALTANPALIYRGVDLGTNAYSRACAAELRERFGKSFDVIFGDSRLVLAGGNLSLSAPPELIHIDGGHDFVTARLDLFAVSSLCGPKTLVLVDDCHAPGVAEALLSVLARGPFEVVQDFDLVSVPEQVLLRLKRTPPTSARSERRAVLVVATDPVSRAEFEVTGPGIRAYAEKIGAEFVLDTAAGTRRDARFPKLAALEAIAEFDRVLVLDTDIDVASDSPDLFDIVPPDRPGLYLESADLDRALWCEITAGEILSGIGMRRDFYANSGVMLLPRFFIQKLSETRLRPRVIAHPRYEQTMVNAVLHELSFPVFNISQMFNRLVIMSDTWEHVAWFHHYAGSKPATVQSWFWRSEMDELGEVLRVEMISDGSFRTATMAADVATRQGHWCRFFSPGEFLTTKTGIELKTNDGIHLLVRAHEAAQGMIFGPYTTLEPGRYSAEFLFAPPAPKSGVVGAGPNNGGITEVYIHNVATLSASPSRVDPDGVVVHEFRVDSAVIGVEFRLEVIGRAFEFYGVRLSRV